MGECGGAVRVSVGGWIREQGWAGRLAFARLGRWPAGPEPSGGGLLLLLFFLSFVFLSFQFLLIFILF